MILEGIVTTHDAQGELNVAPMGPIVDAEMSTLIFRPFQTSQTYRNLKQRPQGVFHVVDDVLLLAEAAIGAPRSPLATRPAERVEGTILESACRWYEFEITRFDDAQERTTLTAQVTHRGRLRDFFGFNRAKHAVLEAAILATRVHLLPAEEIKAQMQALAVPVKKTAGERERAAFALLQDYISESLTDTHPNPRPIS